jgi:isoleucyl-tRNA synthetase
MGKEESKNKSKTAINSAKAESGERSKSDIAKAEEKILDFWKKEKIFEKSLSKPSPKGEFVFYEGPPTANAKPALHHIEARAFKDVLPRYKTMRGFHVRRKAGWDTHGLPVELQVEKKLGLQSKKEIETYGIAKFNRECRENVWSHIKEWDDFTDRIGYWVDKKDPYITYDNAYMESLWNIVSEVAEKKLLYKDYKVVPWCPRCGTALSSHELAQGYEDITDISVYVKFKVKSEKSKVKSESQNEKVEYILAWTTTPWTLPGNVGLAVGENIAYVKVKVGDEFFILAKERLSVLEGEQYEIVEEFAGKDLLGLSYEPFYPYLDKLVSGLAKDAMPNAYKIYPADFVTTEDGTGVVHTAVMYGQEDFELGNKVGLPKFHLVTTDGTFIAGTDFLEGRHVRDEETAVEIIKDLHARDLLFKKEKYKHSYPHCWRCKTALIYYARDSWYIKMSQLRNELLVENEKVNWEPAHIKDGRFGEWLREIKDWAISRERYWGTPLPIWECEKCKEIKVVGSLDDIKKDIVSSGNEYFVMRHGQAVANLTYSISNKIGDHLDELTELGREEVKDTAENMAEKPSIIISSPYKRCLETASIVAEAVGLDENSVLTDERLKEFSVGDFKTGETWAEFWKAYPELESRYEMKLPGENLTDVRARMTAVFTDLEKKYSGKKILIVSHELPIRVFLAGSEALNAKQEMERVKDDELRFKNAEIRKIGYLPLPRRESGEVDFHRPYIDDVLFHCQCGDQMSRVKEVMDVWFDSGGMPFAQDHYPFENKNSVDGDGYPADFISEAIDQTRGWFYTLLAIGVLLGKGTPYKNVICLGHILDSEGRKMSKSVGNVVDPWEIMDKYGIDAVRLWMYSVNQPGDSKNFDEKTVDEIIKKVFNPLSNTFALLSMYQSDVERIDPKKSDNVLDVWVLSKLNELISSVTDGLEKFKLFEPVRDIRDFVQDLSTWYVRRSRERLKSDDPKEKSEAVSMLEFVLLELSKLLAPFAPFFSESLYQKVSAGSREQSVHLESWPEGGKHDVDIIEKMISVRILVTKSLELRQKSGIKVRQPLSKLKVKSEKSKLNAEFAELIKDEVNVKEIEFDDSIEGDVWLDTEITEELREEGIVRDIIRAIQDSRKKENLSPSDRVSLKISTDKKIKSIFEKFEQEILTQTGITSTDFVSDPQKHSTKIDESEISVSIIK